MITLKQLTYLLYKYDPMNTTCTSNKGMENEYSMEAKEILKLVSSGVPFKYAYISIMTHFFWEDWVLKSMNTFKFIELEYYNNRG
jgi:hypothetical protein